MSAAIGHGTPLALYCDRSEEIMRKSAPARIEVRWLLVTLSVTAIVAVFSLIETLWH